MSALLRRPQPSASSAPARPSRLVQEAHFEPSSSSSDDDDPGSPNSCTSAPSPRVPETNKRTDPPDLHLDHGESPGVTDRLGPLPTLHKQSLPHHPIPKLHSNGVHANGPTIPTHTTIKSYPQSLRHLPFCTTRDGDDEGVNSEYTDTDDDEYQHPQLPLTDSRGEKIADNSVITALFPPKLNGVSANKNLVESWAAYQHDFPDTQDILQEHDPVFSPFPWNAYFAGGCLDLPVSRSDPGDISSAHPSVPPQVSTLSAPSLNTGHFRVYWTASANLLSSNPPTKFPQVCDTLFVLVHGAGQSALIWAAMAKTLADLSPNCVIVAPDLRGHGYTSAQCSGPACTLNREQYAADLGFVLCKLFPNLDASAGPPDTGISAPENVVFVGHSLGGAIVAHLANMNPRRISHLLGVAVLDVVEGTAIDALSDMASIIARQPDRFPEVESAIRWTLESGTIHNIEAARVSVPAQVVPIGNGPAVRWRTDLLATKCFWKEWFTGLSNLFLNCPAAKLLVLAGTDRLDKELTIGQMQGKFQMEVLPNVGHNLHADAPFETAHIIHQFAERNARVVIPHSKVRSAVHGNTPRHLESRACSSSGPAEQF